MSIEPTVVLSRLEFIGNYLLELRRFRGMSLENYLSSFDHKTISERIMELIAQAAIDINEHILTGDKNIQPLSNKDSFVKAGQYGIITPELATDLALSAGLRNILAHKYLEINYVALFNGIQAALNQYPIYIQQITEYLNARRK
ncbi:type VII toxin-antitoxin system HepT family RNase toxin [Microcoleus sp. S13_C5]|uniref:type VII toxin-antitoxin system HepT family RNase toxin n=1 Tax=Microcoleus sp. S13_C5 TaxID=3055411 RepID=UPI002FD7759D